jgi:hypothetical protein
MIVPFTSMSGFLFVHRHGRNISENDPMGCRND